MPTQKTTPSHLMPAVNKFQKLGLHLPWDMELSFLLGRPVIDVPKLEALLQKTHGPIPKNTPISEFIKTKYKNGQQIVQLIEKYL